MWWRQSACWWTSLDPEEKNIVRLSSLKQACSVAGQDHQQHAEKNILLQPESREDMRRYMCTAKRSAPLSCWPLFLVRLCGIYFEGPWEAAGLGSTNWLAVTSTQALVPCEVFLPAPKFSSFWCSHSLFQMYWCFNYLPASRCSHGGLILHGGLSCFELCQHGIYGISIHLLFASSWANSASYKRLSAQLPAWWKRAVC